MTMIEKVARAINPRAFEILDANFNPKSRFEADFHLHAERTAKAARAKARAAIEAMREPTDAMSAEGRRQHSMELSSSYQTWQNMIDAALTEQPQ